MSDHTFTMDLTPDGHYSCVLLDGQDISGLLVGVTVRSSISGGTIVELEPLIGCRAQLTVRLPEAQIVICK